MTTTPRSALVGIGLAAIFALSAPVFAAESAARYAVTNDTAENPASKLRLEFPPTGVIATPERSDARAWRFDFRLVGVSFDGRIAPLNPAKRSASENRVEYDFGAARVAYVNTELGLAQKITIAPPESPAQPGALTMLAVDLSVDGELTPVRSGYFIDMLKPSAEAALRFGPVDARGADGAHLDAQLEVATDGRGNATGVRAVIEAVDPVYPIEVSATLVARVLRTASADAKEAAPIADELVGVPVALQSGITETVDQIMARERMRPPSPPMAPHATHHELELDQELEEDPSAPPPLSHWPPIPYSPELSSSVIGPPNLPQTLGTTFKGVGSSESGFIPPDSMGDVGPTQILIHVNGRIKVFSKAGVLGSLNATDSSFWASVASGISDPEVRYDRLSGRWFVLAITLESSNNKIVIAVSSGPTITGAASFTFFSFNIGTPSPADASSFCDYPGFGIDANAIYTGCNMFGGTFHTTAFVIRKSSVTGGGPIVVTGFSNIGSASSAGPYSPRGVDNDDPTATQGYIIGTDPGFLNRINIRRVTNPGTTPTIGPTITLTVSNTSMLSQSALNSTTNIDSSDVRLFTASIHKNKLTGVSSLWTAHSVETDTTCTPATAGNSRRIGARWYEIGNLTTTPTITQFGTLCTTATGSTTSNTERGFIYPSVVETGQGHMALGASYASSAEFVGVAAAGRLRTDPAGGTRAPESTFQTGGAQYTVLDASRNRWGDYSFTDVDPNDDQTVWTIQEYADTTPNNWAVRAIQLKAPPPPVISTSSNPVCLGVAAAPVTITGSDACAAPTCTNGLCTSGGACPEFFDPGPDTGGPGYTNHLTATVTGTITVNSASIVVPANPATQRVLSVALSLNTTGTTAGLKTVTIINPDGQAAVGTNKITVVANRAPVSVAGTYGVCQSGSVQLNGAGSSDPDAACGDSIVSYEWDLNNDGTFETTGSTPTLTYAQLTALGLVPGVNTIKLRVTDTHTATNTGSGTLTLITEGGSCSDGNACTQTDVCQTGVCVGSNPVTCTASDQCHDVGVCNPGTGVCSNPNKTDGTSCSDGNACTLTDTCLSGVCSGGSPKNCSDGNACTSDLCNTGTGACSNPNVADGSPCSDGNACTQTDSCQTGVCAGSNPVVCNASDQCHDAGVCNTGTGVCSNPNKTDGTSCNDANACTQSDSCQGGVCAGLNPVVCTASDACHLAGVCNTGTGVCSNPNAPNGTSCNDANACTQTDTCQTGVCTGSNPVVCVASDTCHAAGTCDTGTGACSNPALPDGTSCNDGDATTCGDQCTGAVCAGHAVSAPAEIDGSVLLAKTPSDTTISWTDAPGPYAVYRGSNSQSASWSYDHFCIAPGVTGTSIIDSAGPSPGTFFYYLVTRFNECRESVPGRDGSLAPIPNATPCPAP